LFAGYAEAKFVYRQAGMILGWGKFGISKKTRLFSLIKLLICYNNFCCLETYSGD
jgi:hypothetical protein